MARRLNLLVIILLLLLGTSNVFAQDDGIVTITVLGGGADLYMENMRAIIAEFEAQNPDIRVDFIREFQNTNERFKVMYSAGVPLDLVRTNTGNIATFARDGMIMDLTPMIEKDPSFPLEDIFPAALQLMQVDGRFYSIPLGLSVEALFYNKNLYGEAGLPYPDETWSWEREMIDYGRRLTVGPGNDGVFTQVALHQPHTLFWTIFYGLDGHVVLPDRSRAGVNTPAAIEAVEFVSSLSNELRIATNRTQADIENWNFINGDVANEVQATYYVGSMQRAGVSWEWDVAPMPAYRGNYSTTLWGETPWMIPSNSENPEAAYRFLSYMASQEGQEMIAATGMAMPFHRKAAVSPSFMEQDSSVNMMAFVESVSYPKARSREDVPDWPSINTTLWNVGIYPVLDGNQPAASSLAEAERQINAILGAN